MPISKPSTYRYNITLGIAMMFLVLLGLILSSKKPVSNKESFRQVVMTQPQETGLSPLKASQYAWQKQELKKAVQAYFENALTSGSIIGAGVSIVKGDSIVFSDGFGKRNANSSDEVDAHTIFRLGSLSKGFTGVLAVKLSEEGELHWNDKVKDYLPSFNFGDQKHTDQLTLGNLLSHTSGAPYHSFTNLVEAGLPLTKIAERFGEVQPISAPGELYSYQNALFALSGEIIYKATGEDLREALKNKFFYSLQMCSTNMDYKSLQEVENVALPHNRWRRNWRPKKLNDHYYNAVAAGGINASSLDMAKWMKFLLGHHPEIMTKKSIEKAFTPVIEIKGRSKYYQRWPGHISSHYGFGWRIHKFSDEFGDRKKTIWHHGGSVNGYRNEIAVFPEEELGICVLLNSHSSLASTVVPDLYQIIEQVYRQTPVEMASNYLPE
ncbi:serine hydrolase domain-containing protein [Muriicola sp. SD30]|uniref:serine hydrolase domain-containing protein n=1 Tax=Muriicola sp. SD30 TaxID=3240936 RepID=UPI00350F6715